MVPLIRPSLFDVPGTGEGSEREAVLEAKVEAEATADVAPELLVLLVMASRASKAPIAPQLGGFPLRLLVLFFLLAFLSGLRVLFFIFEPPGWLFREVFFSREGRGVVRL